MSLIPDDDAAFIVERGADLWPELSGHRIFITGGTGFIGRNLVGALSAARAAGALNAEITVLTRGGDYFRDLRDRLPASFRFHLGDVRTFDFPAGRFSFVIHGAAESARPVSDDETRSTIVDGTTRCLKFAARAGAERVLYLSSGAVYGRQPSEIERISEDDAEERAPVGLNAYGMAKRQAEAIVTEARECETIVARGFAFVGAHLPLDRHFAIGNFIRDALAGDPIVVQGDGTPLRSYLYAADLSVWLLTILVRGGPGAAYNVGSEEAISIGDLARLVARTVRPGTEVRVLGTPTREPPVRYIPSTERARSELRLRVWTPLEEAIRRTANWYSPREDTV